MLRISVEEAASDEDQVRGGWEVGKGIAFH